jgi:S-adenosylmethionine synthetase
MTLEAPAGKNPITHVGKLYNVAASRLAAAIVAEVPCIIEAECYLVSQIGMRIDRPHMTYLRICCHEGGLSATAENAVRAIAEREIANVPKLWKSFLMQGVPVCW